MVEGADIVRTQYSHAQVCLHMCITDVTGSAREVVECDARLGYLTSSASISCVSYPGRTILGILLHMPGNSATYTTHGSWIGANFKGPSFFSFVV